jgi:flagellar hook-length control protein FliK
LIKTTNFFEKIKKEQSMITFDLTQERPATATGIVVDSGQEESTGVLSFSALLEGMNKSGDDLSDLNALLLSFDSQSEDDEPLLTQSDEKNLQNSQKTLLSSLLNGDMQSIDESELAELNPEVTTSLSSDELKQLVQDAKTYLKEQIVTSDGFKRSEVEKLPKTLKGLVDAAKTIGVDLSKITIEEVQADSKPTTPISSKQSLSDNLEVQQESESDRVQRDQHAKSDQKTLTKEISTTALFKEQKSTAISTEQMVNAKALSGTTNTELVGTKKRTDDTLKLLLRGEKSAKSEGSMLTNEFSVATAKVIAPAPTSDKAQSLEALLNPQNISDEDTESSKSEAAPVAKADSFEVKLKEAKQMVKYLSQDVKEAIDNYKAPFTRVKVQLNPQHLGEVELTVVQRGKDLHVNLSSNNAAINTLAMNANDLKVQLQNSGINNASLNFSNNSQGQDQAASQQQQQQNRQNAQDEYNYFENEESSEEILSSLEIVVPNYA